MNAIERRLALRKGVHQSSIKYCVCAEEGRTDGLPNLETFGCECAGNLSCDHQFEREPAGRYDVLLVCVGTGVSGADQRLLQLIAQATAVDLGVCVVVADGVSLANEYLTNGADSAAFAGESAAVLAVALYAAHNAAVVRRNLRTRVAELERKLEQTKMINQAKSILAEQMGVGEGAALRHLRHEARNQRRSMADIAQVIIEARRLIERMSKPGSDGKATKLTPFPKRADTDANHDDSRSMDDGDCDHAAS
ncbi:MAG: ANTAR domain-containing protein [Planctomycetaceae bacterium]|nr:ANTAR domain-containing protein [Planctomycetaceae bacterium]